MKVLMMNMNRAYVARPQEEKWRWHVIDAEGEILGRLATRIANILRGKHRPHYTAHTDCGDYVVVINAERIALTGKKLTDKEYARYSGWIGGLKVRTAKEILEKRPQQIIEIAVRGMLPKNKLNRSVIKKLKVYAGSEHPHKAQVSQ
jgi:large subunit ribosomal protein L13